MITVHNLTKKFGQFVAVNNISFSVSKGEIFGFLGANGAGKTTAIKMLCGLLTPTSGSAEVAGYDLFKNADQIKKNIGYMSQKFSLYEDLTVQENIELYGAVYHLSKEEIQKKSDALLQKLKFLSVRNNLVQSLPLGWKQKLAFSVALLHEPKIIFLDEPTGGVDPITRRQFWDMIYETASRGITIFVTTHYMDEAEYCDRVSIMVDGTISALDTPSQLKQNFKCETMDEVFVKLVRNQNA
jgi:ABC-2 type transport system ATP-binding protein